VIIKLDGTHYNQYFMFTDMSTTNTCDW
jgi:hypothetical protein